MRDTSYLIGPNTAARVSDFGETIAWNDHRIAYFAKYARGKSVLDLGCVMHNPEQYKSRYWVHKALKEIASDLIGLDLYADGVAYLRERGFNVIVGDATAFDLGRQFDVIVAGDVMEHLDDFAGFLESCKKHMHAGSHLLITSPNPWFWKNIVKSVLFQEVPNNPEHTYWLCPRTVRQTAQRFGMDIVDISFGSRSLRERLMPLPRGVKHTTFHLAVRLA